MNDLDRIQYNAQPKSANQAEFEIFFPNQLDKGEIYGISDGIMLHRSDILEDRISNLELIYKNTWKLLGSDYARGAAIIYSKNYNDIDNDIDDFGSDFPLFLQEFSGTRDVEYIADYATLEYLKMQSYEAPLQKLVENSELQEFFKKNIDNSKAILNSSVQFLWSRFSLIEIDDFIHNYKKLDSLKIKENSSHIMICRIRDKIELLDLGEEYWKFFKALSDSCTISQALEFLEIDNIDNKIKDLISLILNKELIYIVK